MGWPYSRHAPRFIAKSRLWGDGLVVELWVNGSALIVLRPLTATLACGEAGLKSFDAVIEILQTLVEIVVSMVFGHWVFLL